MGERSIKPAVERCERLSRVYRKCGIADAIIDADDLATVLVSHQRMREALEIIVAHCPSGVNPFLDDGLKLARAALHDDIKILETENG